MIPNNIAIPYPPPVGLYHSCNCSSSSYIFGETMIHEHANHDHDHAEHDSAKADTRDDAIKRLSYIEGHLAGVKKMVEEDRYCVDILRQTFAVRRALQKLESQLIDGHLRTCVVDGVKQGREEQVLSELVELYEIADR